ncbi:Pyridoxal 5'-phosphate synthase subunit snz1 [Coemansia sp. RSA 2131]|nr:Pyridoxal 5'-phosphate synthase subunit snz1 [Coemansia sp. RSA 2131]
MPEPKPAPEDPKVALQKIVNTKAYMTSLFKGGVIVVVHDSDHAKLAERLGARGLIVGNAMRKGIDNEHVVSAAGPAVVRDILSSVLLPTIGRVRVGHTTEAQIMEACGCDGVDEHEGMTTTGAKTYKKFNTKIPFIAGASTLDTALKAIFEGASMIRTSCGADEDKPDIKLTANTIKTIYAGINKYVKMTKPELDAEMVAKGHSQTMIALIKQCVTLKKLPVPLFADGGIMLPMDAAMMMSLGADGVIASVQVFQAADPARRIRSIVMAVAHHDNAGKLAGICEDNGGLGVAINYKV